jgi:hypothetical protein
MQTRHYGAQIAALLARLPAQAWSALRARAEDGDAHAAMAAASIMTECRALAAQPPSVARPHTAYADHLDATVLPADWIRFLRDIDTEQQARLKARIASCAGVDDAPGFMEMALDRFIQPDDPGTQLAEVLAEDDDANHIPELRGLANQLATDAARRALGQRLIESSDSGNRAEGRALLERLAFDDAISASVLAGCLYKGCGYFHGDPVAAPAWIERAAGLGFSWALRARIDHSASTGQTADAMAWSWYRLELALTGCAFAGAPSMGFIAQAAEGAFRIEAGLDPDGKARARAMLANIVETWEARALSRAGCS